jgi:hypothetical protein
MAKRNGGIIGPSNVPTGQYGGTAKGVWRLRDAFNYIKAGLWPVAGNYPVGNSARFNSASSDYLSRTPSVTGNRQKWTYSVWIKRSRLSPGSGEAHQLLSASPSGSGGVEQIFLTENNVLNYFYADPSVRINLVSSAVFRDVSAWYHIVVAVDTTQATDTNRVKIYVNGSQITFSTATYPAQNQNTYINNTNLTSIGSQINNGSDNGNYFGGYMSEINFINAQQLTPSSFGQTDSATGIWTPLPYTGTYGTNGFFLKFANSAALGTDSSGNGNTFTVNNLTSIDQTTDTPTNNFCTMNPLSPADISSLTEGNLKITQSDAATAIATFGFGTGKWYWELKNTNQISYTQLVGILKESTLQSTNPASFNLGANSGGWAYFIQSNADNGKAFNNNTVTSTLQTTGNNDIISIAVDADAGKLWFGVNGTWVSSGNPATGTNAVYTNLPTTGELLFPAVSNYDGGGFGAPTIDFNFGNPSFTIASGNADGAGYGNFEYAVPSGFYALNTKNLANFG